MSKIILSHPFSGALYGYFYDQMSGSRFDSESSRFGHSYYRTLYGKDYSKYVDLALCFLMMYEEVWMSPADNEWPRSLINPENHSHVPELGLYIDFDDLRKTVNATDRDFVEEYLLHPQLQILLQRMKIPKAHRYLLVEQSIYEANLSARERIPILCSPGRRSLIATLIDIQQPSLHPQFAAKKEIQFVDIYRQHIGLALAPKSLDHLMEIKLNPTIRKYGGAFLSAAENSYSQEPATEFSMANLILEAIDSEATASAYGGLLNWGATLTKFLNIPILPSALSIGGKISDIKKDAAGWYEFGGSIDREISMIELRKRSVELLSRKNFEP